MGMTSRIKVIIDHYANMIENAGSVAKIDQSKTFATQLETTTHPTGLALLRSDIREAIGNAYMGAFLLFWAMLLLLLCSVLFSALMIPLALASGAGSLWYLSTWRRLSEQYTACMMKQSVNATPEEINVP